MRFARLRAPGGVALLWIGGLATLAATLAAAPAAPGDSAGFRQLMDDGNYAEALTGLKAVTLDPAQTDGVRLVEDFRRTLQCFQQLGRIKELDGYRDQVAAVHSQRPLVLGSLAQSYLDVEHQGVIIAGAFQRGTNRGGGRAANALERDRARALQLFVQAVEAAERNPDVRKLAYDNQLLDNFAAAILSGRSFGQSWRLTALTDLKTLPDYEEGWGYWGSENVGAAVANDGEPVLYAEPANWNAAKNDGERWRSVLATRTRWQPESRFRELLDRADFAASQFGVQTMREFQPWFERLDAGDDDKLDATKGRFALETLSDDETIARLATGIKRFKLTEGYNPIALWKQVVEQAPAADGSRRTAITRLASAMEDRRQFARAAEYWRLAIGAGGPELPTYIERLSQIVGPWGRMEPTVTQPAGRGAVLQYRFRNGQRVEFVARSIDIRKLLDAVKKYLASSPAQLAWERLNIDNLGYRLVSENQQEYLGAEAARWTLDLDPRPNHFDRRISVATPLQKPGAYLVTARMEGGNEHHVVVWVADAAIVKKPLERRALYYLADANSGKPLAKTNVEFFGYRQEADETIPNRYRVLTKDFAEFTNAQGLVTLPADENGQFNWLAIATTPAGGLAYLGFSGVWAAPYYDQEYEQLKVFTVTDRPVYRPKQDVHFKFWVANVKYDQPEASPFAGQSFVVEIQNPKGEKVFSKSLVADSFGGLAGDWTLPADATLGQYQILVVNHGGGVFRVEEYKKPEFEVTIDSPEKPVKLGDKFTATIRAKYYFGSPVTVGHVKYKVLRSKNDDRWFPPGPWDWLYGRGYGWFAEDYDWYPGWGRWGCVRPWPWWFWRQPTPPELVAQQEVELGPDGTVKVEVDTAPARELYPDDDQSYRIEVEVTDQSRRTIVANGQVLASRKPFAVTVWAERGFYSAGDTIEVSGAARTLDGRPVRGDGVLRLLKISYDDAADKPVENEVARWDLPTDDEGMATVQIKASEPGQYRLSYEVTSAGEGDTVAAGDEPTDGAEKKGTTIEGGQILVVRGDAFDGGDFRFNDVEIIPEKRQYAAGEKARLEINSNRAGAAVLLFLRPSNGVYLPPQLVSLTGKSTTVDVDVVAKDMPNFFVEAVTVHGGKLHTAVREIFVPPAEKVFNVAVTPSAKEFRPGEKARIDFKLTDFAGKPVLGSTVVAIYDRALDYIAGGDGTADIREFFWKWRRSHNTQGETNLARMGYPVATPEAREMQSLGVFGDSIADESSMNSAADGRTLSMPLGGMEDRSGGRRLSAAVPMAMESKAAGSGAKQLAPGEAPTPGAAAATPTIRQNFADTALWVGSLETDAEGLGHVDLVMPENLTSWKVNVWGMGRATRVGQGSAELVTRKNIIVRLEAPRFFVERDEVVLSAIVHNYLPVAKRIEAKLELDGDALTGPPTMSETIDVPAGGEKRVDWRVRAVHEGTATIRALALADVESDAMQMSFPVFVHGMLKQEAFSGAIRPDGKTGQFRFVVPAERRPDQTRLEVRWSPTLAGAMVDALPYLADYPYGCTEQTLNRFLPAVMVRQTLGRLNVDLAAIQAKRTNLNAQEIGDDAARAAGSKRFDHNPVFDAAELDSMVKAGVNRLTEMQLSDGGWGWFTGWGETSSAHTTAVVVRGLIQARENDVALVPGVLERGVEWLTRYEAQQLAALDNFDRKTQKAIDDDASAKSHADDLDAFVYMVLTDAKRAGASPPPDAPGPGVASAETSHAKVRDYLYKDRTKLGAYSLAMFGLALHQDKSANAEMLPMILRNLSQYVHEDDENQTAYLELPGNIWWYWYGSEIEAEAYYLKLLSAAEPKSEVSPRLVKYLLNNRKHATYWESTRDTALVVEAFANYLAATGEGKPELTVEVVVDGAVKKTVAITPADLFTFDNKLVLEGDALAAGPHVVELRKTGTGPLYFNGYLTNFTLEYPIAATGLELKIDRRYYKLTRANKSTKVAGGRGQAVDQAADKFDRTPIAKGEQLTSGDLVEVELLVESKNDYEYILLEDMKPAGFEPVDVRSGYTGNELGAYVEFRDDRVALFARTLARGRHSVSYRLRAEVPGKFGALPTKVSAMYAPELKANSDEAKLSVTD